MEQLGECEAKARLEAAAAVAECSKALKSFDAGDFGQGHDKGGTRAHFHTRMSALDRVMRRGDPLPADLANDWERFKVKWDGARINGLGTRAGAWGSVFRDTLQTLLNKIQSGDAAAVAAWMRAERRQWVPQGELAC